MTVLQAFIKSLRELTTVCGVIGLFAGAIITIGNLLIWLYEQYGFGAVVVAGFMLALIFCTAVNYFAGNESDDDKYTSYPGP